MKNFIVNSNKKHDGFTLAEVLITLVVIGIIAAMTIPVMMANHKKVETITRLKKVYSNLAQVKRLAELEYGDMRFWFDDYQESMEARDFYEKYMKPYFVALNDDKNYVKNKTFYYANLNSPSVKESGANNYEGILYLNDGTKLSFGDVVWMPEYNLQAVRIYADINGDKGPNIMGRDVFCFSYIFYNHSYDNKYSGIVIPEGGHWQREELLTNSNYGCNKNSTGHLCAGLIFKDGWQISKDYPW